MFVDFFNFLLTIVLHMHVWEGGGVCMYKYTCHGAFVTEDNLLQSVLSSVLGSRDPTLSGVRFGCKCPYLMSLNPALFVVISSH